MQLTAAHFALISEALRLWLSVEGQEHPQKDRHMENLLHFFSQAHVASERDLVVPLEEYRTFFARVWAGELECPGCGMMLRFGYKAGPGTGNNVRMERGQSRLKCPGCARFYIIGMTAWRVPFGMHRGAGLPADARPTLHQARSLQQLRAGRFGSYKLKKVEGLQALAKVNLTEECCCIKDPKCPRHGG